MIFLQVVIQLVARSILKIFQIIRKNTKCYALEINCMIHLKTLTTLVPLQKKNQSNPQFRELTR